MNQNPGFTKIDHFENARSAASPQARLESVRDRARALRRDMSQDRSVPFYRSFGLVRVPYPTRYAFLNACKMPTPYIHILNRMIVVQFRSGSEIKTLLISPSDIEGNRETPFFKRLVERFGAFQKMGQKMMAPIVGTVETSLEATGLKPQDIDYISYDHLHTQDLRKWLGSEGEPGLFPNARLLVMRQEWESTRGLLPPQRDWYCPGGTDGIDPDRLILLEGDTMLGEGVALMSTPGHTEGNHSFVVHTEDGLMVTSENGVAPDAYAPLSSRIPFGSCSAPRSIFSDLGPEYFFGFGARSERVRTRLQFFPGHEL